MFSHYSQTIIVCEVIHYSMMPIYRKVTFLKFVSSILGTRIIYACAASWDSIMDVKVISQDNFAQGLLEFAGKDVYRV